MYAKVQNGFFNLNDPVSRLSGNQRSSKNLVTGGRPGLVVMGADSCSRGRGFVSQHQTLNGHFSYYIVVKIVMFV